MKDFVQYLFHEVSDEDKTEEECIDDALPSIGLNVTL